MPDRSDVCVLIPTLDEAETIGDVVDGFHEEGFDRVLVVDGHSSDGTRDVARDHGATVVEQSGTGKGLAVREAVADVDLPYVLMVDGDGTYDPEDADEMLDPLLSGEADHVVGDRFADMKPGAMSRLNRFGNRVINWLFRRIYRSDVRDILSGYRAFTTESFERMSLAAEGFGIETEMAVECEKHGFDTAVVPITYRPRPDGSATNLRPFRDGGRILLTMYLRTKTSNPLVYFGAVGGTSLVAGFGVAAYVLVEWFTTRTSHDVLALVSAAAILLGVQLLMFGLLSDLMVTLHRETLARVERLEDD